MSKALFNKRAWRETLKHPSAYFGLSLVLLLWLGTYLLIETERSASRAAIRQETVNLARVFEENVIRSLSGVDSAIRVLRRAYEADPGGESWPRLIQRAYAASEITVHLAILDATGTMIATDRGPQPPPPIDLSDREHFQVHAASTSDELFISQPVLGRATGRWSMQVTRRFLDRDGKFAGVIVVAVNPTYFSRFFNLINLGNGAAITLVGRDGVIRASGGQAAGELGAELRDEKLRAALGRDEAGSLTLDGSEPGAVRVASFRWIHGHPLAVIVATGEQQPFGPWHRRRTLYLWAAAAMTLLIATVGVLGLRRTRRFNEARRQLAETSRELAVTLENMTQGIMMIDAQDRICVVNRRCIDMLGLPDSLAAVGGSYRAVTDYLEARGEFTIGSSDELIGFLRTPGETNWKDCYERMRPDGSVFEVRNKLLPDGGFVRTLTDITERRKAEEKIVHLARHDALTGLANRVLFRQRLDEATQALAAGSTFAIHLIDLDRFKAVNDTYGHLAGDRLLHEVAERLRASVRSDDLVARLGGDEFAIIQPDVSRPEQITPLAERICRVVGQPFSIDGLDLLIGASVGIAIAPQDGRTAQDLLHAADLALYAAKAAGRNTFTSYRRELHAEQRARSALENDLRRAIQEQQFVLHYQPIISLQTGRISAYEALVRWQHPERGMISPMEFIPLAEETGLIMAIGSWVLRTACRSIARISNDARVAVNLSPVQFRDPHLVANIEDALVQAALSPRRLEVEITESVLLQNDQLTHQHLDALRQLGVHVTMDDFGTGYSSLSYLLSYPIQSIKIDRSFVMALGRQTSSLAIVRAITTLATALGLSTTAEGVETAEQLEMLREAGCTEVQGYFLGRPAPLASEPRALTVRAA